MSAGGRKDRGKDDLRLEILNAARDMFATGTFEEFSMRKLAARIGYSATAIYLHFTDKRDLLNCVCQETFEELSRAIVHLLTRTASPLEAIRAGLKAYVQFGVEHPNHYKVALLLERPRNPDYDSSAATNPGVRIYALLRERLAEGIRCAEIRPLDLDLTAQSIWASVHGLTTLLIIERDFPLENRDRLLEAHASLLIAGVAAKNSTE
ncbi:MAG: TetR/AcrR family transcriptional regulator [Acidobacteria bacterium]|nr:TetR/AcrR family transcriptional regulator [Acidobacteriota bacterium]